MQHRPRYEPPICVFRVRMRPSPYGPADPEKIWREIEIASNQPLEELGDEIPRAFGFHLDHLWSFYLPGPTPRRPVEYTCANAVEANEQLGIQDMLTQLRGIFALSDAPYGAQSRLLADLMEPSPIDASTVAIRDVPFPKSPDRLLKSGKLAKPQYREFRYVFDFGDGWTFGVKVVGTRDEVEPGASYPRVVARQGEAPPQYPNGDDEEWDDEEDTGEET
ncbi:MAG: hypothetical protein IT305_08060 [Chloroflexi bacterium]|nr:hypothetical protein [Chloroflexota bacterium]